MEEEINNNKSCPLSTWKIIKYKRKFIFKQFLSSVRNMLQVVLWDGRLFYSINRNKVIWKDS